ncbi:mitotic exit network interactor 1 [Histoplasma ohiense]|nr:mitotic exit network interactor 1 [Histoplasma ohiense (nom. inval.)]
MSAFTFGFGGDDIDNQDVEDEMHDVGMDAGMRQLHIASKESHDGEGRVLIEASQCDLDEMLSTLPSQISYNMLSINPQSSAPGPPSLTIPRREVFDIRAQLMAEDDADTNENAELISGLEKGDLKPTVYEGGLKTWECAIDLAKLVAAEEIPSLLSDLAEGESGEVHVIELGAGTAIPSLSILYHLLSQPAPQDRPRRSIRFVFADYNAAVLRLVTVPNILLTWHMCLHRLKNTQDSERSISSNTETGSDAENRPNGNLLDSADADEQPDLDVDHALLCNFRKDLHARGISLSFISGAWSPAFVDLALPNCPPASPSSQRRRTHLLILASETIYSPSSLRSFSETLLALLRCGRGLGFTSTSASTSSPQVEPAAEPVVTDKNTQPECKAKALIAAKEVYFGVGGGVDEFLRVMRDHGRREGQIGGDGFSVTVRAEVRNEGVGRVVLEVTI